ncbi:cysteine desulfurase family protein [Pararhodobacter sp. SW119]|uniref:cysteine desulfurase family protein n=1 Tax=Pararhodobacter sp. SW119 TaxID=2780075 RepID=UPI001ADEFEF9|nr:cysteine desulfurase family protein [Pararhodobacter sp. SW119]
MHDIYLDFNASTPVAPEVADIMRHALETGHGNPSSSHWAGAPARQMVANARVQVAALVGCAPREIVFTSGGSEANNHALKGVFFASGKERPHFVTSSAEHPAIVAPLRFLERLGARLTWLPVDGTGLVDPDDLRRAIKSDTVLVTIMHANNETGTIQPIAECAAIAQEYGVRFHTDAAQSVGKIPTRVDELGVDLLTMAGHKFHAPKGVGALFIRDGLQLEPFIHGAGHEGGRRAGTESALLTAALGVAASLAADLTPLVEVQSLRDRLWDGLSEAFGDGVVLNGHPERRLPNTLNVAFGGRVGAEILAAMPEVAASTGSACHSGRVELSPVLEAMGVTPQVGMGAIRFSLGRATTIDEVEHVLARRRRRCRRSSSADSPPRMARARRTSSWSAAIAANPISRAGTSRARYALRSSAMQGVWSCA